MGRRERSQGQTDGRTGVLRDLGRDLGPQDEKEKMPEGEHERFIVNTAGFLEKVAQKGSLSR